MNLQPWQRAQIEREVIFEAVRSRGPGGQNVNKVASAAQLYWSPLTSAGLLEDQRFTLLKKLENRLNADGFLQIRSDEFRDLPRNRARGLAKLLEMLEQALHKPKRRIATKPTRASKQRKLESKSRRSEVKKMRQKIGTF